MARTLIQRIRRAIGDMNHGQQRAFEMRTGQLSGGARLERERDKAMLANLEAHWRM
jgi:hypothetical protein